ncbi:MAG: hypothetical protein ACE5HA_01830 [Anaerolineae bacterium]
MAPASATTTQSTILERQVDRLSAPRVVASILIVFVLSLVAIGLMGGVPAPKLAGRFWIGRLMHAALFGYLLLAHRFMQQFRDGAIDAFRSLVTLSDEKFDELLAQSRLRSSPREWVALVAGAGGGLLLVRPWRAPRMSQLPQAPGALQAPALQATPNESTLMVLYAILTAVLAFGLMGWVIYRALAGARLFSDLHRQPLNIDIFDPTPLEPAARMSLSISVALIGATTLPLILTQDPQVLLRPIPMIINGTLVVVAVIVFFLMMASTHRVMAEAKEQKLKLVRDTLSGMFEKLEERTAAGELYDMEALSDSITAWLTYKKQVEEAAEWPYTTETLRNLLISTLVPVLAWTAQIIVEYLT